MNRSIFIQLFIPEKADNLHHIYSDITLIKYLVCINLNIFVNHFNVLFRIMREVDIYPSS